MTEKRFKFVCDDENCFFKDNDKVLYLSFARIPQLLLSRG